LWRRKKSGRNGDEVLRIKKTLINGRMLVFRREGGYFSYTLFEEGSFLFAFIMLLCGGFFRFILTMYAEKIATGQPLVTLTPEDLELYLLQTEKINIRWEDIEAFIPYRMHSNSFIGLVLKDEERYAGRIR